MALSYKLVNTLSPEYIFIVAFFALFVDDRWCVALPFICIFLFWLIPEEILDQDRSIFVLTWIVIAFTAAIVNLAYYQILAVVFPTALLLPIVAALWIVVLTLLIAALFIVQELANIIVPVIIVVVNTIIYIIGWLLGMRPMSNHTKQIVMVIEKSATGVGYCRSGFEKSLEGMGSCKITSILDVLVPPSCYVPINDAKVWKNPLAWVLSQVAGLCGRFGAYIMNTYHGIKGALQLTLFVFLLIIFIMPMRTILAIMFRSIRRVWMSMFTFRFNYQFFIFTMISLMAVKVVD